MRSPLLKLSDNTVCAFVSNISSLIANRGLFSGNSLVFVLLNVWSDFISSLLLLFSTLVGSAVEFNGSRSCVDAHYRRGLSFLKIGLRWLTSFVHKNFSFLRFDHLPVSPSAPCFASLKARDRYYLKITFSFIREHDCAM